MKNMPSRSCAPIFIAALIVAFVWAAAGIGRASEAICVSLGMVILLITYIRNVYYVGPHQQESIEIYHALWTTPVENFIFVQDALTEVRPGEGGQNEEIRKWKKGWSLERFDRECFEFEARAKASGEIDDFYERFNAAHASQPWID